MPKKQTQNILRFLRGKKTVLGTILIGLGTVAAAPLGIPAGVASILVYAGTAMTGAGAFDKVSRAVSR